MPLILIHFFFYSVFTSIINNRLLFMFSERKRRMQLPITLLHHIVGLVWFLSIVDKNKNLMVPLTAKFMTYEGEYEWHTRGQGPEYFIWVHALHRFFLFFQNKSSIYGGEWERAVYYFFLVRCVSKKY